MAKKKTPDFEEQMQRLQAIIVELERMDLSLEKNVALYKEGRLLAASCKKLLENAKNEVLLCDAQGMKPFMEQDEIDVAEGGFPE